VGNLVISVMAPPRFASPLCRTRTVPGAVDAPHPSRRSRPAVKDWSRAASPPSSMRCPVQTWPRHPCHQWGLKTTGC